MRVNRNRRLANRVDSDTSRRLMTTTRDNRRIRFPPKDGPTGGSVILVGPPGSTCYERREDGSLHRVEPKLPKAERKKMKRERLQERRRAAEGALNRQLGDVIEKMRREES